MEENPKVLDFVKAVSDQDRLRIIGLLSQHPAGIRQVADELGLAFRVAFQHLAQLEFAGLVHKASEAFELNESAMEQLSKQQFEPQPRRFVPAPGMDTATSKVLVAYLNADGSLKLLPTQPARLEIILRYLQTAFEPGRNYTEKEVNDLLRRFHPDTAALRRALVDAGLVLREGDGSRYWLNASPANA